MRERIKRQVTYLVLWMVSGYKINKAIKGANKEKREQGRQSVRPRQNDLYVAVFRTGEKEKRLWWCSIWNYKDRVYYKGWKPADHIEANLRKKAFYVTSDDRTYEQEQAAIRFAKQKYKQYLKLQLLCKR